MANRVPSIWGALILWLLLFFALGPEGKGGGPLLLLAESGGSVADLLQAATTGGQCDTSIADTYDGLDKPNQSKVFYFDAHWWMVARRASVNKWTLWRYDGGLDWVPVYHFSISRKSRPDASVHPADSTLYIFISGTSSSSLQKFTYDATGQTWQPLYDVTVPGVSTVNGDPAAFLHSPDGDLWAFMADNGEVMAAHSNDDGASWSTLVIDNNLNSSYGLCDAVSFQDTTSAIWIGVGVGEDTGTQALFHFYRHRLGNPEIDWIDESDSLGPLDREQADDHIAMTVDPQQNVYMITKNHGTGPKNSLYVRHIDGTWNAYSANDTQSWTRPAIVVDADNDSLIILGSVPGDRAEYKKCRIGEEWTLFSDGLRVPFLQSGTDYMVNLSVPAQVVHDSTDLLVIADNSTRSEVWFAFVPLGAPEQCPIPPTPIDSTIHGLTISRSGNDVILNWQAIPEADSFVVYRALHPMFNPDTSRLAVVTTPSFVDSGAMGDPQINHFYLVRAFFAGQPGPPSARMGEYEYRLISPPGKTNNYIAICLRDTTLQYASDFVSRIGASVTLVSRWIPAAQAWGSYIPGLAFTDFPLQVNEPYMISVSQEDTLWLLGEVPIGHQYQLITTSLKKNNNAVAVLLDTDTLSTASQLATSVGSAELVSRWLPSVQAWGSYIPGLSFTDFPISPGQPLMVSVKADTTWPVR